MQYGFSCLTHTYDCIERTLSSARLARYLPAANNDKHLALRLYMWNASLCEAFYMPLQITEVSVRNAVEIPLRKRFGTLWYSDQKFINLLPPRIKEELAATVTKETRIRGARLKTDHIIANVSFGFWTQLMSSSYDKQLWANGVRFSFPAAGPNESRAAIHSMLEKMRAFRNKVMHHYAIFDQGPQKEYQNLLQILDLICPETQWLVKEVSKVSQTINNRPSI